MVSARLFGSVAFLISQNDLTVVQLFEDHPIDRPMIGRRFDFVTKIVVVGDTAVGKTSLLCKFIKDVFSPNHVQTMNVEYQEKIYDTANHRILLQLWDTAGEEMFRSVARRYYRGAAGALITYDLNDPESFAHVDGWLTEVKQAGRADAVVVLLGNKADKIEPGAERPIPTAIVKQFAEHNGIKNFDVSALTGQGIADAIGYLVEQIEARIEGGTFEFTPPKADEKELEVLNQPLDEPKKKCNC
jgi:small GTP-binding protein